MAKQPRSESDMQPAPAEADTCIEDSCLPDGFVLHNTVVKKDKRGRDELCFEGMLEAGMGNPFCDCGSKTHVNNKAVIKLRHIRVSGMPSVIILKRRQYLCPKCGATRMQEIPFKKTGHLITLALHQQVCHLLANSFDTYAHIADICGIHQLTVKNIEVERLQELSAADSGSGKTS